ncbi:MAG TPA: 6-carboxytetrahydropterin synthase QueD [Saprospiraceae bacterium]|nr:6-carboxytetrahydropterin synthase QueD [Saprospiraceae bacterium]
MEIFKEFTFDSAHFLPNVPDDHKCKRMHGHTYRVRICLQGPLDPKLNWVEDFGVVKGVWKPVEKRLDHHMLNDIEGLENPTAEAIAIWIWRQLKTDLPKLIRIEVYETPTSGVIYRGEYE